MMIVKVIHGMRILSIIIMRILSRIHLLTIL